MKHLTPQQAIVTTSPLKTRHRKIIEWVSKRTGISIEKMLGRSHKSKIVRARWIAINLIWRHPQTKHLSMSRLGQMFGGRDHSTIRFAILHYTAMPRYLADTATKRVLPDAPLSKGVWKSQKYNESAVFRQYMAGEERKPIASRHGINPGLVTEIATRVVRRAVGGDCAARTLISDAVGLTYDDAIIGLLERFSSAVYPTRRRK